MTKKDFILASSSPRRIEMLRLQGCSFRVVKPYVDESCAIKDPAKNALAVSVRKAKVVALKHPNCVVLSADTIVVLGAKILGKPKDKKDALKMLTKLNAKTHRVITAFTVATYNKEKFKIISSRAVISKVTFGDFSKKEYLNYVDTKEPLDKAGAYAIQGLGCKFVKSIQGSYTNIVGLPFFEVTKALAQAGVTL